MPKAGSMRKKRKCETKERNEKGRREVPESCWNLII
jgi:hypothetical protein